VELTPIHQAQRLEAPAPLEQVLEVSRANALLCRDHHLIRLGDTALLETGEWRYNGEAGLLSRHSLAQLCSRLELPGGGTVPAGYLSRCPEVLAAENLNHWLQGWKCRDRRVFVRTKEAATTGPQVRAVLSDRYAVADHRVLLEALCELVPRYDLVLQAWSLDDEQLTVRLSARGEHPVSLRDPLRIGVHISNSEIGLGRIAITALITRLVCTNGLVVKAADLGGIHRRHIGRAGEDLETVIRSGMGKVLEEADVACRRFVRLREEPAPSPVDEFVRTSVKRYDLPERVGPLALQHLAGETLYDVVNAFTRAAQTFPVHERLQIETTMSQFLRGDPAKN